MTPKDVRCASIEATTHAGAHARDTAMIITWANTNDSKLTAIAAMAAVRGAAAGRSYRLAKGNLGGSHACDCKREQVEGLQSRLFTVLRDPDDSGGVGRGES